MTFDRLLFFVSGGGFMVGLFAAALLWGSLRGDRTANRLLAMLMVVSAFNIVHPALALLRPDAYLPLLTDGAGSLGDRGWRILPERPEAEGDDDCNRLDLRADRDFR